MMRRARRAVARPDGRTLGRILGAGNLG